MSITKLRWTTTKTCGRCDYRFITDDPDVGLCIPCTKLRLDLPLTSSDNALMDAQMLISRLEERIEEHVALEQARNPPPDLARPCHACGSIVTRDMSRCADCGAMDVWTRELGAWAKFTGPTS